MSKRAYILIFFLAGLSAIGASVYFYSNGQVNGPTPVQPTEISAANAVGPTPLPEYFEAPDLASRRIGPLRLYVVVENQIPIQKGQEKLDRIPIRIALENETYRKLDLLQDIAPGNELFKVTVVRGEDGSQEEVFTSQQPASEISGWEPAERKTFIIDWPIKEPIPGSYLISVTPGFGSRDTVRIRTVFK